jgi:hypothetical protein
MHREDEDGAHEDEKHIAASAEADGRSLNLFHEGSPFIATDPAGIGCRSGFRPPVAPPMGMRPDYSALCIINMHASDAGSREFFTIMGLGGICHFARLARTGFCTGFNPCFEANRLIPVQFRILPSE